MYAKQFILFTYISMIKEKKMQNHTIQFFVEWSSNLFSKKSKSQFAKLWCVAVLQILNKGASNITDQTATEHLPDKQKTTCIT